MTKIVGILNITPDSFSDGGRFTLESQALTHLDTMLAAGADVIDIGAESTRPSAVAVSASEEWLRISTIFIKIVEKIKHFNKKYDKKILLSLDSRHFTTIKQAYEIGIDIINDVSGLQDEKIIDFIAKNNIKAVLMHNLSVPADPNIVINSALNVTNEILKWGHEKIAFLEGKGVKKSQLIFDPGIGFSKSASQSIRILRNIDRLRELGLPLFIGHSKKSFLDEIYKNFDGSQFCEVAFCECGSGLAAYECHCVINNNKKNIDEVVKNKEDLMKIRAKKTLMISAFLAAKNVEFIRVHDVLENKEALQNPQNFVNF